MAAKTLSKTEKLLRMAERPLRARDLDAVDIPRSYLARLVARGLLDKVDRGLYLRAGAEVTELHTLAEVAARVPHGVMCLLTALRVHGLTTQTPHVVWLLIERQARAPKLSYPKLAVGAAPH